MKNLTRNTLIAATVIGLGVIGANLAAAGPYGGRGNCQNGGYMSQQMGPGAMSYPRGGMGQPMMNPQMRQQRMQQHLGAAVDDILPMITGGKMLRARLRPA